MIEYFCLDLGCLGWKITEQKLTALKINLVKRKYDSITLKRNNEWNDAPKNAGRDGNVGHMLKY